MSGRDLTGPRLKNRLPARLAPYRWTIGATGGLMVASLLTSATGFVFWWMAARLYSTDAVGLAGAAVSTMLLLSQIAMIGLGTALVGVLHREERPASLVATALLATGLAGLALGIGFALLAPLLAEELAPLSSSWFALGLFALGVALTVVSAVIDQVLVAVSRSLLQVARNTIFGFARLPLLALVAVLLAPEGMAIYLAWLVATAASLAVVALIRRTDLAGRIRPLMWYRLGEMASDAAAHHVVNLSRSATVWLLPLLVTITLGAEDTAGFYVALLFSNFILLVGKEATFTLYIVGARAPGTLWHQLRFTLGFSGGFALVGTVVLTLFGPLILSFFGPSYVESAYPTIAILALSSLPILAKDHWIAIHRVRGSVRKAAVVGIVTVVIELGAAVLGAVWGGLVGFATARLIALLIEAAFMTPMLIKAMRRPLDASGEAPVEVPPSDLGEP
jgi:O-antigen/teichoic acid export membrane protein